MSFITQLLITKSGHDATVVFVDYANGLTLRPQTQRYHWKHCSAVCLIRVCHSHGLPEEKFLPTGTHTVTVHYSVHGEAASNATASRLVSRESHQERIELFSQLQQCLVAAARTYKAEAHRAAAHSHHWQADLQQGIEAIAS